MPLIPLLLVMLSSPCDTQTEPRTERYEHTQVHMGAPFTIVAYAASPAQAKRAMDEAFARIAALDFMLSDYKSESELNRLSRQAPTQRPVKVSRELFRVLTTANQISNESKGAFDVTVGPLTKLWRRARRRRQLPPSEQLRAAMNAVGYRHIKLHPDSQTVELLTEKMRIDLGGIAKGYAVDQALQVMRRHEIRDVLVNGGGDVAATGSPPGKRGWLVGIAPLKAQAPPSRFVMLSDKAVATSGDAWQYVEVDGKRFSHILDPRTGVGLATRSSVSVVAANCMLADAYASAVSVLGQEKGLAFIEKREAAEALVVVAGPDDQPQVRQSKGFVSQDAPK